MSFKDNIERYSEDSSLVRAASTDYAKSQGLINALENSSIWLRSPSDDTAQNAIVAGMYQTTVNNIYGIRPMCYIQL